MYFPAFRALKLGIYFPNNYYSNKLDQVQWVSLQCSQVIHLSVFMWSLLKHLLDWMLLVDPDPVCWDTRFVRYVWKKHFSIFTWTLNARVVAFLTWLLVIITMTNSRLPFILLSWLILMVTIVRFNFKFTIPKRLFS